MKPLQIFKPGKQTASDGRVFDFTETQLRATADAYDPALHEAPLCVGHPTGNAPAYGWTKALSFTGTLNAEAHQVDADFAELVNAGKFKKMSASFYHPEAQENPKPGVFYLRHIGFLGAQPPAVKGLKSAEFSGSTEGVVEFMDWSDKDNASLWRALRDWMIGKFGKDEADKVIPDYTVTSLQEDAVLDDPEPALAAGINYQERNANVLTKEQLEAQKREQDAKAEEQRKKDIAFAEREAKIQADESVQRRTAISAEVDALVAAGKLLPKDKAGLVAFMETLPAGTTIEFGEAGKKVTTPTIDWLRGFLKTLPKAVEFRERGAGDVLFDANANPLDAAADLSRRALEFQDAESKAGRTINIAQAVQYVKSKEAAA